MSIRVMADVWARSGHENGALLMLLAIADYADDAGRAFPSVAKLAEKARVTARHARRVLGLLVESRELEIEPAAGPRRANLYRIRLRAVTNCQPDSGVSLTPASASPDAHVSRSVIDPSLDSSVERQRGAAAPRARAQGKVSKRKTVAQLVADGWEPSLTAELREEAAKVAHELGISSDPDVEFMKFTSYWQSAGWQRKGGPIRDLRSAWRNWCLGIADGSKKYVSGRGVGGNAESMAILKRRRAVPVAADEQTQTLLGMVR